jgi:hypothetical protein
VVAAFDGGAVTSDGGALLLRHTDRAIGLIERVAACFVDGREQDQVVHTLAALVGQRIAGIALGYEDVNDHDELRHDPVLALFAEKLEPKRSDCAPLAGKSTLNRLEHAPWRPDDRYHKIGHDPAALANLFVDLFLEAQPRPPKQIVLDLDATDDPAARPAGGAVLPRLLQLLLLFALIRILRAAPARRPAAVLEHRRLSGRCGRGGPHR